MTRQWTVTNANNSDTTTEHSSIDSAVRFARPDNRNIVIRASDGSSCSFPQPKQD